MYTCDKKCRLVTSFGFSPSTFVILIPEIHLGLRMLPRKRIKFPSGIILTFGAVTKHKQLQQELHFKQTLEARALSKDVTVYSQQMAFDFSSR